MALFVYIEFERFRRTESQIHVIRHRRKMRSRVREIRSRWRWVDRIENRPSIIRDIRPSWLSEPPGVNPKTFFLRLYLNSPYLVIKTRKETMSSKEENPEGINPFPNTSGNGEIPSFQGDEKAKASDFANYFCSYAQLYHQKQMLACLLYTSPSPRD